MKGIVVESTGSWYKVEAEDKILYRCKLRGHFKIKGIKSTNPIAVGDIVDFKWEEKAEMGWITKIHERKNYIIRKSVNLSKRSHIIASNIDLALLIITLNHPRTSTGFIDRFLITCEAYHIKAHLIFNKIDLYTEKENTEVQNLMNQYESIGYKCYKTSAKTSEGLETLRGVMGDKTCLVSGHSGVGKSALINAIDPSKDIRIGEISDIHNKGKHTTTYAQMHTLDFGARIIDSPGIKEFGLFDFKKEELCSYFPEMIVIANECKYNNCTHVHEPQCAVKDAVELGYISADRYLNYLNMLDGKEMNEGY
ncbi:MAG: ribosome small subunit-dependent GTPase A [Bacteroidetes bacterium 4572_112]|nr:MAG: ribosome small subunit-dependent GTPase A [Bacteroidetes bacterium 4572_112]